jgi:endo-alpha-1,4-polygalactosaminidase (GH114 family)
VLFDESQEQCTSCWKEQNMADHRTITGQADRMRINMNEDYEVRYWMQKWSVSREQHASAVREAGVMVKDVAKRLGKEG